MTLYLSLCFNKRQLIYHKVLHSLINFFAGYLAVSMQCSLRIYQFAFFETLKCYVLNFFCLELAYQRKWQLF